MTNTKNIHHQRIFKVIVLSPNNARNINNSDTWLKLRHILYYNHGRKVLFKYISLLTWWLSFLAFQPNFTWSATTKEQPLADSIGLNHLFQQWNQPNKYTRTVFFFQILFIFLSERIIRNASAENLRNNHSRSLSSLLFRICLFSLAENAVKFLGKKGTLLWNCDRMIWWLHIIRPDEIGEQSKFTNDL